MTTANLKAFTVGAALVLAASGAFAQSTANPSSAPTTLGVTPQEASQATQNAVPRADTGTVVRTAPGAATPTGNAAAPAMGDAPNANMAAEPMNNATGNAAVVPAPTSMSDNTVGNRPARADRN